MSREAQLGCGPCPITLNEVLDAETMTGGGVALVGNTGSPPAPTFLVAWAAPFSHVAEAG